MKKYIKLMICVVLIWTASSCKEYLQTESNSTFTEESVFTNLDFATKMVYGIYSDFMSWTSYDMLMTMYYKIDNDIEFSLGGNDNGNRSASHYAANDGTINMESAWNQLYKAIEKANICIDNLPSSPIWEGDNSKEAHRLYGEAVTLRALMFYELVSLWGDVPFSLKSTQSGDDYYLPKTDRDEIYEYLIEDLKNVENYIPWMTETRTAERINRGFVKGLRARMALSYAGYSLRNKTLETRRGRYWENYYKIANRECRELMESGKHFLNPSFENVFKKILSYEQDQMSYEVLFEIAFGRLYSGRVGYLIGMNHRSEDTKYGRTAISINTSPYYYYSFDNKDLRRNTSVELYDYNNSSYVGMQYPISANGTSFTLDKWRKSWITPTMGGDLSSVYRTGVNWPIMRYADVILMFAESENQINGPTQAAKEALSLIRKRAFSQEFWNSKVTHYIDSVSTSKESFFNAIVDERAWEFGGELIRKYDLVRWNLLGTKLKKMKEESNKIIDNDQKYANVPTYLFWKRNADGESISILNPDYRLPGTTIDGYTRMSWLPLMSASNKTSFTSKINLVANGYDATKNNHLYPIPATIITASKGILSNDQIP